MITIGFKNKTNVFAKAFAALALGCIMLYLSIRKVDPFSILTKALALFVMISGVVTLIYSLLKKDEDSRPLLIGSSIFNIVLGILIFVFSGTISSVIFFLLAGLLFLFGLWELIVLVSLSRYGRTGWLYVLPVLSILLSVLIISPKVDKGYICSIALIVFGISELMSAWRVKKARSIRDEMKEAEAVEVPLSDIKDVEAVEVEAEFVNQREDNSVDEQ